MLARRNVFVPLVVLAGTFVAFGLSSQAAAPKVAYFADATSVPHLVIRSDAPEGDAILRSTCPQGSVVELRLGAEFDVGHGNGAAVALSAQSAGTTAKISGVSLFSIDSRMTGSSELLATVPTTDPIFSVLTSGATIRFSGAIDRAQSVTLGATATKSLKKFLADCAAMR
jgi:hypothetical protein